MKQETNTPSSSKKQRETSLRKDTRGLSSVEYLILLVVIAVAGIAVWPKFATSIENQVTSTSSKIDGL